MHITNLLSQYFGKFAKKEEKILREYFNTTYKNKKEKESLTWAFISWNKI